MSTLIWDLPTRLFHWTLALAVSICLYTGLTEGTDIELHAQAGVTVLGLLIFRVLWGLVGGTYAKFSAFNWRLGEALSFLRSFRVAPPHPGHDPAGSWAVLILLLLLLMQSASGLFQTDELFFEGPLYSLADEPTRELASYVHHRAFIGVLVMIALHLMAMLMHGLLRRENLVGAMVHGKKTLAAKAASHSWAAAIAAAASAAGLTWYIVN